MKTICIYHGNCFDGMAAALVVKKAHPDAEFIPGNYGDSKLIINLTQDCYENANINDRYILVDFSLPRDLMKLMDSKAGMLVLDHHKTAQVDCEGLPFCVFDMNESGASLAWKHFFPGQDVPRLIKYIADRDLWRFGLAHSNEVNAFIQSFPMTLESYGGLLDWLEDDANFQLAIEGGASIERYKAYQVDRLISNHKMMHILGFYVPVVNTPVLMSEVGAALASMRYSDTGEKVPFGAYYFDRADGMRQWGARSVGDFDVSNIARAFGGGGHKNAAGWQEKIAYEYVKESQDEGSGKEPA